MSYYEMTRLVTPLGQITTAAPAVPQWPTEDPDAPARRFADPDTIRLRIPRQHVPRSLRFQGALPAAKPAKAQRGEETRYLPQAVARTRVLPIRRS